MKVNTVPALIVALFTSFIAPSSAQSNAELEAQIQALLAQIAALNGGGETDASPSSCNFTQTLTLGSTGAEVVELQSFLEGKGLLVLPAGESKGYFGALTQSALASYQAMVGISPATGYFGPVTRAHVNGQCSTVVVEVEDDEDIIGSPVVPASYPAAIAYAIREAHYVQFTASSKAFIGGEDVLDVRKIYPQDGIVTSDDIFDAIEGHELELVITDPEQEIVIRVEVRNASDHPLLVGIVTGKLDKSPWGWAFPSFMEEIDLYLPPTLPFDTGDDVEKAGIVYKNSDGVADRQESLGFSGDYIFIPVWALGTESDVLAFSYDGSDFYSSEVKIYSLQTGLEKEALDIELEFEYASIQNLVHAWSSDRIARIDLFYLNLLVEMKEEIDLIVVDNDQLHWRLPAEKLIVENLETGVKTIHVLAPNERNIIDLPSVARYRFWFESKNTGGGKG